MNNLLMLAYHPTSVRVMIELGHYARSHGRFNPILIALSLDPEARVLLDDFDINYIDFSDPVHGEINSDQKIFSWIIGLASLFKRKIVRYLSDWNFWKKTLFARELKKDLLTAKDLLDRFDACGLIVPDDRVVKILPYLKVAHQKGLKTFVIPPSFSNQTGVSIRRLNKIENQVNGSALNRLISQEYPSQVHEYKGHKLLFYEGALTQALIDQEMLPFNPWVVGGGASDYLVADGYDSKAQAIRQGVPENKIEVTGHVSHDFLYTNYKKRTQLRKEITQKHGFSPKKKLIICAVPHLAEHNMISWKKHWVDINALVQVLSDTGHNVLLSLHPKSNRQKYSFLEKKYRCRLAQENLDQIIVAAQVFVAGYSSTIRWAALAESPSIVLDFNFLGYHLYDEWQGVLKANSPEKLAYILRKLLLDAKFYRNITEAQRKTSKDLTIFDGNARKRIFDFIVDSIEGQ